MDQNQHVERKDLKRSIAKLESQIDYLETEFSYLNDLLIHIGFEKGIQTLKKTAEEMVEETSFNTL